MTANLEALVKRYARRLRSSDPMSLATWCVVGVETTPGELEWTHARDELVLASVRDQYGGTDEDVTMLRALLDGRGFNTVACVRISLDGRVTVSSFNLESYLN